jgi:hypothetical protein
MSVRDFKKAATCFFDTMATFTSTELMEYRSFVKYAIFCCLVAQDRGDIKKQVGEKRLFSCTCTCTLYSLSNYCLNLIRFLFRSSMVRTFWRYFTTFQS